MSVGVDDDELNAEQWRAVAELIDVIQERDPDFPLRNAERCMTRQAWGLALAQIEQNLLTHEIYGDENVDKAYRAADKLLPRDQDGSRLPFGILL